MTLSLPMVGLGLSYSDAGKAAGLAGVMVPAFTSRRFDEQLLESALGVGLAYAFGLGVPSLSRRCRTSNRTSNRTSPPRSLR